VFGRVIGRKKAAAPEATSGNRETIRNEALMNKSNKADGKGKKGRAGAKKNGEAEASPTPPRGYLIRIPDRAARLRAVMVLGDVPGGYSGFPDYQFLVTPAHVEVLRREDIPFDILS
jgi:hypothetical protein